MLKEVNMDLHIHTCLSPCADNGMLPAVITLRARQAGLHAIGICDHNTAQNVSAVQAAGRREAVAVLGGMEVTTAEEIHILALFDELPPLATLQGLIHEHLPGNNDEQAFGEQIIVNEQGRETGREGRLLIGASDLKLGELVSMIRDLGGLAIASHIDRPSYSIIGQLGFIPAGLSLNALELSPRHWDDLDRERHGLPLVSFSDAHAPEEIGRAYTGFRVAGASVAELKKALRSQEGRGITGRRFRG